MNGVPKVLPVYARLSEPLMIIQSKSTSRISLRYEARPVARPEY